MKVSLLWLKQYVDIDVPVEELCRKMIMSGFEVESVEDLSQTMNNVVVGRILKLEKHPNADRLQVCLVDVGGTEPIQIITGADNVFEGALVPVALHNSKLPNGMQIKKGKLRGVESHGMLCSGAELCLKEDDYKGAELNGILILNEDYKPGTDMRDVLDLNDVIIDFAVTANRPDCQSVIGIAREIAVVLNKELKLPKPEYKTVGDDINKYISITVEDYNLCPRYMGRMVKNLRIKESPGWMKKFLKSAGVRSINNIVDITNFVMLETGQPMHAFDYNDIKGSKIIVRTAKNGERIATLDGKEHTLNSEMLVIADAENPSCLAGIIGSENSGIKDNTTDLFLECAKFRRDNIRKTSRALGVRTESSSRFEKGVDILNVEYAMNRALQLIYELDAGDIIEGVIDCNKGLPKDREISVSVDSINQLLGINVPADTMCEILNQLQISTTLENGTLHCRIPSFRDDIEGRADIAEEIIRVYGYDHIVGTTMRGNITRGKLTKDRTVTDKIKSRLISHGFREITTYSFISGKALDTLCLNADDPRRNTVTILNPLGEEYSTMRTQLITSMLTVISTNYNRKNLAARLFEVSKLFVPKSLPVTEQPNEIPAMSIGLYGKGEDFFTLKGIIEDIYSLFGMDVGFARSDEPYLHPGRQAKVVYNGKQVAVLGEVHPKVASLYDLDIRVYVSEIQLLPIIEAPAKQVIYKPLPKFPAVIRDLALVCDVDTPVGTIEKTIRDTTGDLLEELELFDIYQGEQIEKGKKSVAYRITLRSHTATLTDEQVSEVINKTVKSLEAFGVYLRQ